MLLKDAEGRPLPDLLQIQRELDQLIAQRREEAANEAREALKRTAEELGISVRRLVNGTIAKRARRTVDSSEASNDE